MRTFSALLSQFLNKRLLKTNLCVYVYLGAIINLLAIVPLVVFTNK